MCKDLCPIFILFYIVTFLYYFSNCFGMKMSVIPSKASRTALEGSSEVVSVTLK